MKSPLIFLAWAGNVATYLVGDRASIHTKMAEAQDYTTEVARSKIQVPKSNILLPLYVYPAPGAWAPLSAALSSHRDVQFKIIVNPHSGPGTEPWWPNEDYVREVPKLNAAPNAHAIGYVRTGYCQRPIAEVLADIDTYAGWSSDSRFPGLGVHGIFFDETVNIYSPEVKEYLDTITEHVKAKDGILGDRTVIHNPGTAVNASLAVPGPDITTIVEEAYGNYETKDYQDWLATSPYDRARSSYMVHSVPGGDVTALTLSLRERAKYLFITDLTTNFYESFGPSWRDFVRAMARNNRPRGEDS